MFKKIFLLMASFAALPFFAVAQDVQPAMPVVLTAVAKSALTSQTSEAIPDLVAAYAGKKFNQGPKSRPRVALTFDDGPHPTLTPLVVEILKQHDVKATFFMLGQMAKANPATARLVAEAGMEIGSHSHTHANLVKLGEEGVRREISDAAKLVGEITGRPQRLFRPPYGNINANVTKVSADDGLVMCHWSVDPRDWEPGASASKIAASVVNGARNGSVILLHDIKPNTVEALPQILEGLKAKGFEVITMGEMIEAAAIEPAPQPAAATAIAGGRAPVAPAAPLALSLDSINQY